MNLCIESTKKPIGDYLINGDFAFVSNEALILLSGTGFVGACSLNNEIMRAFVCVSFPSYCI